LQGIYLLFGTALVSIGSTYLLWSIAIIPGFDTTQAGGFGIVGFFFIFAAVMI
jgi:hypothetical protein